MIPSPPPWLVPPANLKLAESDVHVWRASFHQLLPFLEDFNEFISDDERARARRYRFDKNRQEYIVGRGLLRHLLGCYLDEDPTSLQFVYNPYGKPALMPDTSGGRLNFNVSHAHDMIVFAFSRNREIGVDVERIRPEAIHDGVAERFFSANEVHALRALPLHVQPLAFFNCWTRKEAYIKARGEGLNIPLNQFDVSLVPGEPAALLNSRYDHDDTSRWILCALDMGTQYAAALAVEGNDWEIRCWDWRT